MRARSSRCTLVVNSQLYGRFTDGSIVVFEPPVKPVLGPSSLSCALPSPFRSVHDRRLDESDIRFTSEVNPIPSFFMYLLALALTAVLPEPVGSHEIAVRGTMDFQSGTLLMPGRSRAPTKRPAAACSGEIEAL